MNGGHHDNIPALVRMANQIAMAFRAQTHESAVAATAEHIKLYWSKKMRADIFAHLNAGGDGLDGGRGFCD